MPRAIATCGRRLKRCANNPRRLELCGSVTPPPCANPACYGRSGSGHPIDGCAGLFWPRCDIGHAYRVLLDLEDWFSEGVLLADGLMVEDWFVQIGGQATCRVWQEPVGAPGTACVRRMEVVALNLRIFGEIRYGPGGTVPPQLLPLPLVTANLSTPGAMGMVFVQTGPGQNVQGWPTLPSVLPPDTWDAYAPPLMVSQLAGSSTVLGGFGLASFIHAEALNPYSVLINAVNPGSTFAPYTQLYGGPAWGAIPQGDEQALWGSCGGGGQWFAGGGAWRHDLTWAHSVACKDSRMSLDIARLQLPGTGQAAGSTVHERRAARWFVTTETPCGQGRPGDGRVEAFMAGDPLRRKSCCD